MNGLQTVEAEWVNGGSRIPGDNRTDAENRLLRAALDAAQARIIELEMLADTDTLTPLANRRAFLRELDRMMKTAARHGTQSALLFIDLDGMKTINDTHGHLAGDALLIHVAGILRAMVRATDIVARLGGDEFGIILTNISEDRAHTKAQTMMAALEARPLMIGNVAVPVKPSWGVTMISEEERGDDAIARADAAMYACKAEQRDCVTA